MTRKLVSRLILFQIPCGGVGSVSILLMLTLSGNAGRKKLFIYFFITDEQVKTGKIENLIMPFPQSLRQYEGKVLHTDRNGKSMKTPEKQESQQNKNSF